MLKINEEDYKQLYKDGFIYFDNNKRYINLNKLIGLDKEFIDYMKKDIKL